jgi:hypothetical protein
MLLDDAVSAVEMVMWRKTLVGWLLPIHYRSAGGNPWIHMVLGNRVVGWY